MDNRYGGDRIQLSGWPQRARFKQPLHFGVVDDYFHHGDEPAGRKGRRSMPGSIRWSAEKVEYNDYTYTEAAPAAMPATMISPIQGKHAWYFQRDVLMDNRHGGDRNKQLLAGPGGAGFEQPLHLRLVDDYLDHADQPAGKRGNGLCPALLDGEWEGRAQRLHLHRTVANSCLDAAVSVGFVLARTIGRGRVHRWVFPSLMAALTVDGEKISVRLNRNLNERGKCRLGLHGSIVKARNPPSDRDSRRTARSTWHLSSRFFRLSSGRMLPIRNPTNGVMSG